MTRTSSSRNSGARALGALVLALAFFAGCHRRVPIVQIPKAPLGDGGKILRGFYRGFWEPPGSDEEDVTVGLVPAATRVRLRTLSPTVLRVYSERESFEVVAEKGTVLRVESTAVVRPPIVRYAAVVEIRMLPRSAAIRSSSEDFWRDRGFPQARWLGPPSMDFARPASSMQRWALALADAGTREAAAELCGRARKVRAGCRVIPRVDLPALARGRIETEDGGFAKFFEGFVEIQSEGGAVRILDFIAEPRVNQPSEENYATPLYAIPVDKGQVTLVQKTKLRDYLDAVVPSEIFASAPIEAVKAQAVVARTYAMRHLPRKSEPEPFMICASTLCQVYRGVNQTHPNAARAVRETASLVLWSQEGEPAETFYHGICGGHTESAFVLQGGTGEPYLAGVSDGPGGEVRSLQTDDAVRRYLAAPPAISYCGASTFSKPDRWRWTRDFDEGALRAIAKKAGLTGPLTGIEATRRGVSGRILALTLISGAERKTIDGELTIRTLFGGLLSSLMVFDGQRKGAEIAALTIRGAGYGHGVGMCQVGAIGRAEAGQDFARILGAYYPGTTLAPLPHPAAE